MKFQKRPKPPNKIAYTWKGHTIAAEVGSEFEKELKEKGYKPISHSSWNDIASFWGIAQGYKS